MQGAIGLIEPLIPALRRYGRSLLQDQGEADDLVQDCLERAIGRWGQRRADGDVRAWLFSILHNLALNRLRQRKRRGRDLALDDAPQSAFTSPPSQEHAVRHGELLKALARLTPDHRSVLLMVAVEDLSYAEVGQVLGVPVGTVMSRLSRARDALRALMDTDIVPRTQPILRRVK